MNILNAWRFLKNYQSFGQTLYNVASQPNYSTFSENFATYSCAPVPNTAPAQAARLEIQVLGNAGAGSSILLANSAGASVALFASFTPTAGQFLTFSTPTTASQQFQTAQTLAAELRASAFGASYDINVIGGLVVLEAIAYGTEFNFVVTSVSGANMAVLLNRTNTNSVLLETKKDYSLFCEVYKLLRLPAFNRLGGNVDRYASELVGEIAIPYTGGDFVFNVDGFLKNHLGVNPPVLNSSLSPTYEEKDRDTTDPTCLGFFVNFGDSFRFVSGGEKKRIINATSDVRFLQLGASDLLSSYDLGAHTINTALGNSYDFLTKTKKKDTRPDALEFIQYLESKAAAAAGVDFGVEIDFVFVDGSTLNRSYPVGSYDNTLGGNIQIDVSPFKLQIASLEAAQGFDIKSYTLRVYADRTSFPRSYSNPIEYVYKKECGFDTANLVWLNEFGGYDSLTFKQNRQAKTLLKTETRYNKILPLLPNPTFDAVGIANNSVSTSYEGVSFLLDAENYQNIEGLVKSPNLFIKDGANLLPILIEKFKYEKAPRETLYEFSFTYRYANPTNTIKK